MALFDPIRVGSSAAGEDYEIDRSLRFVNDSSTYLERTPSSDSNRTTMTLSVWVKRGKVGEMMIMESFRDDANRTRLMFDALNRMQMFQRFQNNSHPLITESQRRDSSAWLHLVWSIDTTQSTSSNRVKMYVNGVQQSFISGSNSQPDQNEALFFNKDERHTIGVGQDSGGLEVYYDGYMAEMNFIDGQQLPPSSFAETDSVTGEYKPIEYEGTYGTNGFYLKFADNSGTTATTLGKDSSGNGNNFTPNNFGTGDSVKDTPTNNFCTFNPTNDSKAGSVSEANLRYTGGGGNGTIASTFGIRHTDTQGYYFEARIISGNQANRLFVGIGYTSTNWINVDARGANDDSWVLRNGDGVFIHNSSVDGETTGAGGLSVGDIIQIAVKGSKIWVGKNGSYFFSGNPSGDSTPKFSDIADTWTPVADVMTSNVVQFNFGQDSSFSNSVTAQGNTDANGNGDFYHSPPTGFLALCSKNLPNPTIKLPDKHFDILLYSGTGSTQNITGLEFQPDWVWVKKRNGSESHDLQDAVRGATKRLESNNTNSESTVAGSISSFNSDGFTVVDAGTTNESGNTYVAWCWNGGGSTVTNNVGDISSQVRANTTAGFSIVGYTGNGTSNSDVTIGHGLGVAPDVVIIKKRGTGGSEAQWGMLHHKLTSGKNIFLQTTSAEGTYSNQIKSTQSTTFTVNVSDASAGRYNRNGENYIAYCLSEVPGYSKFGKYTGNGNSDGTFVFTGFRPAWVMVKNRDSSYSWDMNDSARDPDNVCEKVLAANLSDSEATATSMDFCANGFKLRVSNNSQNRSGDTFIYLAFAELPFKNARAR